MGQTDFNHQQESKLLLKKVQELLQPYRNGKHRERLAKLTNGMLEKPAIELAPLQPSNIIKMWKKIYERRMTIALCLA